MHVCFVQGTHGDDDAWWRPGIDGFVSFHDAVKDAGHTVVNGRPFEWDCQLGGVGFTDRDLKGWRYAGLHLWDRLDPSLCRMRRVDPATLCIIAHSHGRQVVKYACHMGLQAATVIFVAGPVRKDVDAATRGWDVNVGRVVTLNGAWWRDWIQRLGGVFDGKLRLSRDDDEADHAETFADADHGSLLRNPAQYHRVIAQIHP